MKKKKIAMLLGLHKSKKNCVITNILKKLDLSDDNYWFGLCKLLKYNALDVQN